MPLFQADYTNTQIYSNFYTKAEPCLAIAYGRNEKKLDKIISWIETLMVEILRVEIVQH